jgi:3-hydroxyisobutyrate dehydrogenase
MRVGLSGLGAVGLHMARNLHRAGLLAGLYNRTPRRHATWPPNWASRPIRIFALAASVDAIVCCVSADADVLAVVQGLAPAQPRRAGHGLL